MRGFALLVTVVAACSEHGSAGVDGDRCGDLGCASLPGTLTLTVLDSQTQQPVAGMLMFSANGAQLPFACSMAVDLTKDACPSWKLSIEGGFDVAVTAPAHRVGMIHVRIDGPAGCCGTGPDTAASLALDPL